MPAWARAWTATSQIAGDQATKFEKPAPDRLIRNVDATLCQHFLDVAKRQREPGIEPNRVLYDYRRKAMSLERYPGHSETVATPARPGQTLNVSMPLGLIYAAVGAHGRFDVQLPHGPDFFQFGTEKKMTGALGEAGFLDVKATCFEQYWRMNSAADLLDGIRKGTVRANALLSAQSDDAINGILRHFRESISGMANSEGSFDIPLPAIIGSGAKP